MSLYEPPGENVTKRSHFYLASGVIALFAIAALVVGVSISLVATTSPAAACGGGCGDNNDNGGYDDNGDNGDDSGGCGGGCGGGSDDGGHDHGDDGNDNGGDCGGCGDGGDDGGNENGGNGNGGSEGSAAGQASGDPDDPWWGQSNSMAINSNRRGNARPTLFGMRKTITKSRIVYVQPRQRVVYVRPSPRIVYARPQRVRVIRPRIVRQARPVYRTRVATRGGRYPTVIYTAPAIRYAAPAQRRVIYAPVYEVYGQGRAGGIEAYAARGRVGVEARRVVHSSRGRVVVRSLRAYAQGRNARVSIGGREISRPGRTRIYGAVERRGYASQSYIYADDSGADILNINDGNYRAMMTGRYR